MDKAEVAENERVAGLDDTFRAIGLYFVRFSALVYRMRFVISWRLTRGHDRQELGELALAHAQAQAIADSFFTMCRFDGNLDDAEQLVCSTLCGAVSEVISERNGFAHGDWWTNLMPFEQPADSTAVELIRMQPKRRKGDFADLKRWTAKEIDERSNALHELHEHVIEFGVLALGLPIVTTSKIGSGVTIAEKREYRVKDVFTVRAGKGSGKKAAVLRNGPQAHRIIRVVPETPQ
jgi:hypothetical protein